MKKIISLIILSCTFVLTLASCQLSTIIPPVVTTTGEVTSETPGSEGETTTSADTVETPVTYDFMGTDLTQFVDLGEYKGIKIEDKRITVTDEMVTRYISEMLISADLFTKQRTGIIEEYTVVSMDYVGKVDGVAFEGGSAKDFVFLVSENANYVSGLSDRTMFIAGFAEAMIGKDISKEFDINVKFPENYGNDLSGKNAVFTITVNHILKADELTADNVKKLSSTENITVDDFVKQTKEDLVAAYNEAARNNMNVSIWNILIDGTTFKALPDEYINEVYGDEIQDLEAMSKVYGMTVDQLLAYYGYASKEALKEEVIKGTKQSIIFYQIVKNENLVIDDEAYEARLEELAKEIGYKVEDIKKAYTKEYLLDRFYFEDVTDFLYTNATLVPAANS